MKTTSFEISHLANSVQSLGVITWCGGTAVPTHDIEGNLLTDGHYTYTWDARNRMTSVSKGSYTWSFQYYG